MPLRIISWSTWQRPFIYETQRKRVDKSAPVVMKYIALATRLDDEPRDGDVEGNWCRFKRLVGGRVAETWLVRTLQYVGDKSALDGVIRLSRESFCLALSRDLDVVSQSEGSEVYDALIASGIAEEWTPVKQPGQPPGQLPGKVPGQPPGQLPGSSGAVPAGPAPARSGAPARVPAPDRARPEAVAEAVDEAEAESESPPVVARAVAVERVRPNGHGGGSASPSVRNGKRNGEPRSVADILAAVPAGSDPLTDAESRGVLAACGAITGQRDVDPAVLGRAKSVYRAVRARTADPAEVREFVRSVVYPRTPARIAYLAERKDRR